jgi:hypothetical protein
MDPLPITDNPWRAFEISTARRIGMAKRRQFTPGFKAWLVLDILTGVQF